MKNKYEIADNYVIIHIKGRKSNLFEMLVDLDDFKKLLELNYSIFAHYYKSNGNWYAGITIYLGMDENGKSKNKSVLVHRFILGLEDQNIKIDHINHNTMDNRKVNLRAASESNNCRNRGNINSNNKTGYRNVCFSEGWFIVQMQVDGKNKILKKFKDVDEAGAFAKEMRDKYYGEYSGI